MSQPNNTNLKEKACLHEAIALLRLTLNEFPLSFDTDISLQGGQRAAVVTIAANIGSHRFEDCMAHQPVRQKGR